MLVVGDRVGAVARFDGSEVAPDPGLARHRRDARRSRRLAGGVGIVLGRNGEVWRAEENAAPRPVIWDTSHQAFMGETGARRATHAVRAYDGGAVVASDGGVIVVGQSEPLYFSSGIANEAASASRARRRRPPGQRAALPPRT